MKERTILASGQVKIKGLMGQSVIRCLLQALFPLYESGLGKKKETQALKFCFFFSSTLQTCAGSGGDLGGSPARSLLSLVAVHNGVSLTALPPKLHRKVTLHLERKQKAMLKYFTGENISNNRMSFPT